MKYVGKYGMEQKQRPIATIFDGIIPKQFSCNIGLGPKRKTE